jgi:hypothetical protein
VHEIRALRVAKGRAGYSTKDGVRLKKTTGRRKVAMMKLLDERCMWMVLGTAGSIDDHRMDQEAVKKMLQEGKGPWVAGAETGTSLDWGKLALRCTNELARCTEEAPDLLVQKRRLEGWAKRTLSMVEKRLGEVRGDSGKGILLGRWRNLLKGIIDEVGDLMW